MRMWVWAWAYEHEQIYLEYLDDGDKFFYNISMPCRNDKEIFFHVYMDESQNGWKCWMKVKHQWIFWMINASKQIVWMKDSTWWNVLMKLIPKQLCWMKSTCAWMKITKWMKYLDENGTTMNFLDDKWK